MGALAVLRWVRLGGGEFIRIGVAELRPVLLRWFRANWLLTLARDRLMVVPISYPISLIRDGDPPWAAITQHLVFELLSSPCNDMESERGAQLLGCFLTLTPDLPDNVILPTPRAGTPQGRYMTPSARLGDKHAWPMPGTALLPLHRPAVTPT